MIPIDDRVGLAPAKRTQLESMLAKQHNLGDVIQARLDVLDVVVQDEYTHDVVVAWEGVFLVYDTT